MVVIYGDWKTAARLCIYMKPKYKNEQYARIYKMFGEIAVFLLIFDVLNCTSCVLFIRIWIRMKIRGLAIESFRKE